MAKKKVKLEKKAKKAEKPTSRKRTESQYLKVRNRAKNIFKNQIDKSAKTKRTSIFRAFERVANNDYTIDRFIAELNESVEMLLDSKCFGQACEDSGLNSLNVATQIAFDGESNIRLVLKNGLKATYYTQLVEFKEPLFS